MCVDEVLLNVILFFCSVSIYLWHEGAVVNIKNASKNCLGWDEEAAHHQIGINVLAQKNTALHKHKLTYE